VGQKFANLVSGGTDFSGDAGDGWVAGELNFTEAPNTFQLNQPLTTHCQ
jgi:hypothetical protein